MLFFWNRDTLVFGDIRNKTQVEVPKSKGKNEYCKKPERNKERLDIRHGILPEKFFETNNTLLP